MVLQPFLQCGPRTMQPNHRIVRRETELGRDLGDRNHVHDHAPENLRVLGLQLLGLSQDAPAVGFWIDCWQLGFIECQRRRAFSAELVDDDVANDAADPRLGPTRVLNLIRALERTLRGNVQRFLGVDASSDASTHDREQAIAPPCKCIADRVASGAGVWLHLHDLSSIMSLERGYFNLFKDLPRIRRPHRGVRVRGPARQDR